MAGMDKNDETKNCSLMSIPDSDAVPSQTQAKKKGISYFLALTLGSSFGLILGTIIDDIPLGIIIGTSTGIFLGLIFGFKD
ncbi:hypothetical protein CFELI_08960 [Corynebacterium felinum]|nr:hypothetical protein CFELI_08960 [Corynebacterium felinum]